MLKQTPYLLAGAIGIYAVPATAHPLDALPLSLSMEAASETIQVCAAQGYKVAVSVVDTDGVIKIQARGDGSPIHSQRFSFRKAFTIVSMGPEFGVDTSGSLVKALSANPVGIANIAGGTTDLLFLPGAVVLKAGNHVVGAIGVSGAARSTDDEACAQAGIAKIQERLNHMTSN